MLRKRGFTLIELLIAAGIFAIIALFATGAMVSVFHSNRKSTSLQAVMANLNLLLEEMSREMRFGTNYRCAASGTQPLNCAGGGTAVTFRFDVDQSGGDEQVTYRFIDSDGDSNFEIERRVGNGAWSQVSSGDLRIIYARFYVTGATSADNLQPRITVVINAETGVDNTVSEFTVQNTLVQRKEKF